jgi:hypothetical protein
MIYTSGGFRIADLSSEDVQSGTFTIVVTLSDGKSSVATNINVKVFDPSVFATIEETPLEEEVVDETATGEDVEVTSNVDPTDVSRGSSEDASTEGTVEPET